MNQENNATSENLPPLPESVPSEELPPLPTTTPGDELPPLPKSAPGKVQSPSLRVQPSRAQAPAPRIQPVEVPVPLPTGAAPEQKKPMLWPVLFIVVALGGAVVAMQARQAEAKAEEALRQNTAAIDAAEKSEADALARHAQIQTLATERDELDLKLKRVESSLSEARQNLSNYTAEVTTLKEKEEKLRSQKSENRF